MTHTPWTWERVEGHKMVTEHTLNGPDVLCRYWGNNPPTDHARLIAAAPELLEELDRLIGEVRACWGMAEIELRQALGNTNFNVVEERLTKARAAIEAATNDPR